MDKAATTAPRIVDSLRERLESAEHRVDRLRRRVKEGLGRSHPLRIIAYPPVVGATSLHFRARVVEGLEVQTGVESDSFFTNLWRTFKRYESDEVPLEPVLVHCGPKSKKLRADHDGFVTGSFELHAPREDLDSNAASLRLEFRLPERIQNGTLVSASRSAQRLSSDATLGIISDLDDTIVKTGATSFLTHAMTVLGGNAKSRIAFPGLPELYRALVSNKGKGANPIYYVSSSPWNLYGMFEDFLKENDIPQGPFFLKNFGLGEGHFLKGRHDRHKRESIEFIFNLHPELRFILVGDSGQRDLSVYEELVREHPGRVGAIFLRDVSSKKRDREVQRRLDALTDLGVATAYGPNLRDAARVAVRRGWIQAQDAEEVERAIG